MRAHTFDVLICSNILLICSNSFWTFAAPLFNLQQLYFICSDFILFAARFFNLRQLSFIFITFNLQHVPNRVGHRSVGLTTGLVKPVSTWGHRILPSGCCPCLSWYSKYFRLVAHASFKMLQQYSFNLQQLVETFAATIWNLQHLYLICSNFILFAATLFYLQQLYFISSKVF